jgi:ATP-dependent DNA helicase RecQ
VRQLRHLPALSTVVRLQRERNQRFGAGHLIDILSGKQTPRIVEQGHNSLSTFGIGADLSDTEWRGVVRQLLAQGLLAVHGDGYGTLVTTEASGGVLNGSHKVLLRREPEKAARAAKKSSAPSDLPAEATGLFEKLRAWRAAAAREQSVPAYIIFGDATLRGIALSRPESIAELGGISGVGEKKLDMYGEQLLEVVASS